jgi:oligoribonuclease
MAPSSPPQQVGGEPCPCEQHSTGVNPAHRRSIEVVLVWMDLEMTGLDHTVDTIVEIIAEGPDIVIHQPADVLDAMNDVVTKMHTESGLLDEIRASDMDLATAGARTLEFLREHCPQAGTVPLCGNSIGTDRRFLARYLPDIENHLHYRSVDVSSIKELARRWNPDVLAQRRWKANNHRALDDIRESVAELRLYRDLLFRDSTEVAAAIAARATTDDAGT